MSHLAKETNNYFLSLRPGPLCTLSVLSHAITVDESGVPNIMNIHRVAHATNGTTPTNATAPSNNYATVTKPLLNIVNTTQTREKNRAKDRKYPFGRIIRLIDAMWNNRNLVHRYGYTFNSYTAGALEYSPKNVIA